MLTPRGSDAVRVLLALAMPALLVGCQATVPTTPSGVLSTIHQKTLELAAKRALDQAGITTEKYGAMRLSVRFEEVQDQDLGKQHVRRVITDRLQGAAQAIVDQPPKADRSLVCYVLLAGVDVSQGAFFGFSWIDTKAEVQLRFQEIGGATSTQTEGAGTAKYSQVWWLGIGPSESLK